MVKSSRGRPKGGSDARERLVNAARLQFLASGYRGASVRAIAREAGVDHALVNYHFGSKRLLFAEAMALQFSPTFAVEAVFSRARGKPAQRVAEEFLTAILAVWEQDASRSVMQDALEGVLGDPAVRGLFSEFITAELLAHVREHIGGPDAARRAAGVSTVVSGLVFARYLVRIEPMASLPPGDVVRTLAPTIALQLGDR